MFVNGSRLLFALLVKATCVMCWQANEIPLGWNEVLTGKINVKLFMTNTTDESKTRGAVVGISCSSNPPR